MTGRPTIAAVIVNYNYGRFLPDAIRSVLSQSVPFHEVVVVDDGSTDDSMQVLDGFRDALTVLAISNSGQLGACRAGLAAVESDYVYFLDADDYARPDLVETVAGALATHPVKVQFQLEGVSPDVGALESVFPTFPADYDARGMRADNVTAGFYVCPPTSGNLYRRRTLAGLALDDVDQRDFIDGPATMVLPYLGEIVSIDRPLACYRVHGGNHSQWSEPTPALLAHETAWFGRRWEQARTLLAATDTAVELPPSWQPLYVVERLLMIAALENDSRTVSLAARFVAVLLRTSHRPRQKVLLGCWAVALVPPVRQWRRSLVRARRSPLNRSHRLRRLLALVLRGRPGTESAALPRPSA